MMWAMVVANICQHCDSSCSKVSITGDKADRSRMKRLHLRRSKSGSSQASPTSPGTSTAPSLTSGSMDSYASVPATGTDATETSEHDEDYHRRWKEVAGDPVMSPQPIDDGDHNSPSTERQSSNPFDNIGRSSGDKREGTEDEGTVIVDSPTGATEE
jgi:hypothetical protein